MVKLSLLARIWAMIRHTKAVFLSPSTPLPVKIVLVLGLLYVLSPFDLIPLWVPVFGIMDDLALVALLVAWANKFSISKQ
jgi:uncharacterized membrane protein YkvA (DUF1232 family)